MNIPVEVVGDTVPEEGEFFFLRLTNATNAVILDPDALRMIEDDDCPWGGPKYWKKQYGSWPVEELVIGSDLYSCPSLLDILSYHGSDSWWRLAHEFVATQLNLAAGSRPAILPVVDEADAFLAEYTPHSGKHHSRSVERKADTIEKQLKCYNKDLCEKKK